MKSLLRIVILGASAWLVLAGASFGRELYFRNGETLECQSLWRQGDAVVVQVNRDTVLRFSREEVDMRRTFPRTVRKVRAAAPEPAASTAAEVPASPPPSAKAPAPAPAPPASVSTPPATPTSATPKPEAAKPDPAKAPAPEPASKTDTPATPPSKAELERQTRENAQLMTQAIEKKDPELMKKALEGQQKAVADHKQAVQGQGGAPPKDLTAMPQLGMTYLILLLLLLVLMVASLWIVFEKSGEAGWKCLVPLYNMFMLMKISGKPGWWMLLLFIPLAGFAFQILAMISLAERFGRGALFGIGLSLLPMVFFPLLAFGSSPSRA